jgi:hypothetical protein
MTAAVTSRPSGDGSASDNSTKESRVLALKNSFPSCAGFIPSRRGTQRAKNGARPVNGRNTAKAVPAPYYAVFTARNVRRRDQKDAPHQQWDRKPCGQRQPAVDRDHATRQPLREQGQRQGHHDPAHGRLEHAARAQDPGRVAAREDPEPQRQQRHLRQQKHGPGRHGQPRILNAQQGEGEQPVRAGFQPHKTYAQQQRRLTGQQNAPSTTPREAPAPS